MLLSLATYRSSDDKKRLEQLYGLVTSRRHIAIIMKKLNLNIRNKRRFRVLTTNSNHNYSMIRRGNCYDNAVAESFFHLLKIKLNHQRLHFSNNYMSLVDFENQLLQNERCVPSDSILLE